MNRNEAACDAVNTPCRSNGDPGLCTDQPAARAQLPSSAYDMDIVGLKFGMSPEEIEAGIKAFPRTCIRLAARHTGGSLSSIRAVVVFFSCFRTWSATK
jgi:hypothetical protein